MTSIDGLYGVTLDRDPQVISHVHNALLGGASIIQYRNKSEGDKALETAVQLAKLCRQFSATFLINDDIDLALTVDADGVHLGKDDVNIAVARARLGDKIIGISCYNDISQAVIAEQQGADYVAFGRFYPSKTKPQALLADTSLLVLAKRQLNVPVVAIGGITTDNAKALIDSGADAVAVIDGLFGQENVKHTARVFSRLF